MDRFYGRVYVAWHCLCILRYLTQDQEQLNHALRLKTIGKRLSEVSRLLPAATPNNLHHS
jgi:hypothetical protein